MSWKKRYGNLDGIDRLMSNKETSKWVKEHGYDKFLDRMNEEYPDYNLSSVSVYWEDDPNYICKLKGENGDIVIGWDD